MKLTKGRVWWGIPIIPALGKLRQEDHPGQSGLYRHTLSQIKKKKKYIYI
jgi:hypothetical protein